MRHFSYHVSCKLVLQFIYFTLSEPLFLWPDLLFLPVSPLSSLTFPKLYRLFWSPFQVTVFFCLLNFLFSNQFHYILVTSSHSFFSFSVFVSLQNLSFHNFCFFSDCLFSCRAPFFPVSCSMFHTKLYDSFEYYFSHYVHIWSKFFSSLHSLTHYILFSYICRNFP